MNPDSGTSREFMFKPRQFLGPPLVVAPRRAGHVQAAVQFIIPGLTVGEKQKDAVRRLLDRLGREVWSAPLKRVASPDGKEVGTIVAIAFHVPQAATPEALIASIDDAAIAIVERFLGMLSFLAGLRLAALHTQTTHIQEGGSMSTCLHPLGRAGETRTPLHFPEDPFGGRTPTNNIFISLFWLRRALAERDPLDTYAAVMVSLQAIAREVVQLKPAERRCSKCGHLTPEDPGVSAMVRELLVGKLGATPDQFAQLWKTRNAVVAHGNQPVDAGTFLRATELKFEAVDLCYKGVKLAMGLPLDGPPRPDQSFFVTSALMYVE
ncbi:MAG: hypothetical protein V1694_06030 [Candidatus Eisenbacteria bacterium]